MKSLRSLLALLAFVSLSVGLAAASHETERQYLSGRDAENTVEWGFFCTAGRNSGFWGRIGVPSNWELQGYGTYNYGMNVRGKPPGHPAIANEQGRYRHRFTVPETWKGRVVKLVFEGSMTDTEAFLNGQSVGSLHQGAFYRFSYDVTPLLKLGEENLLEVTVSKESANTSVNEAERRGDYWNFGGIFRPVYLEALPERHLAHCAVDAKADGSFRAVVELGAPLAAGESVRVRLADSSGKALGSDLIASGTPGSREIQLQGRFPGVRTWTAETPVLHTASFSLEREGAVLHALTERFGFRTFEIRKGDGFYLNGSKVILKGVNRHCFRPETGRALSPRHDREDILLMREMNMNTVRSSHYPPDKSFLELCDELGLYVLNELGGWHGIYDTEVGTRLAKAMVRRDVNHPSVLFWDNGNETGWNIELDDLIASLDLQGRPVLHPLGFFNGVHTFHYRSYEETRAFLAKPDIFFPTEFLHGLFDGGHGAGLFDYWELMRKSPNCAGGLLWVFADEGILRTDLSGKIDTAGSFGPDGIVGPSLEKEGSVFTIREVWSPVVVTNTQLPENFDGTLQVENRHDFINLSQCRFEWSLARFPAPLDKRTGYETIASGIQSGPPIGPHQNGSLRLSLPADWRNADALFLTARNPAGESLWTWSWTWRSSRELLRLPSLGAKPKARDDGIYVSASVGNVDLRLDWESGMLDSIYVSGRPMHLGKGPRFIACRRADRDEQGKPIEGLPKGENRKYVEIPDKGRMQSLTTREEDGAVILEATFDGILRRTTWRLDASGTIRLDYEYAHEGVVDLMGIGFRLPENRVKGVRWLGKGPYRSWQNRTHGTHLNVWGNAYNDTIPGVSFVYPEFKGFFQAWRWAVLETVDGSITLGSETGDNYLGLYEPKDGLEPLLYTFPQMGITVLDVIPPVRNKVNATELIGPQSQPHRASGLRKGTIYLRFEGLKP